MFNLIPWKKRERGRNGGTLIQGETHPLVQLRDEFDALFDRFWSHWPASPEETSLLGQGWNFGLEDQENEFVIRAEAPGFEPDEFDVQISGNLLTIKAEHKEETKDNDRASYRYGTFRRTMTLPQGIEADKIDASYRNGVLEVRVPKGEQARGKRIAVKAQ